MPQKVGRGGEGTARHGHMQGEVPQPQGGGDSGTSAGEGLNVKDFMATPLPTAFAAVHRGENCL